MYREIYIDVVFVTNFLMDFVLLRLAGMLLSIRAVWYRSLMGAAFGSLSSCLILMIPTKGWYPAVFLLHLLTAAAMAGIGCRITSAHMLARAAIVLYLLAFLCGGLWNVLAAGKDVSLGSFLFFAGLSYFLAAACIRGYRKWLREDEVFCKVRMKAQGKTLTLTGFYDTGNLLTDPVTGKPVSIVEEQAMAALVPAAILDGLKNMEKAVGKYDDSMWESLHPHFIIFYSVGDCEAMLPAVTLEDMCIYRGEQAIYVYHPVVAVSSSAFHSRGKYQVILNGRIL